MENKVLEENIEHIKGYDSNLANEILMFENEKSNVTLAQNESGDYNLVFNSIPLHSIENPILEANNISQHLNDEKDSITIIYGLGLGYLIDSVCEKIKMGKIIIYEPNIDLIKYVFQIAKIDGLYKKNVFLCSNEDKLKDLVLKFCTENTKLRISFLNSYKNLFEDDIKKVLYNAQKAQGQYIGNKNTILNKANSYFLHILINLKTIFKNPTILNLKDIYKGKTALILCAGPSLEENIELIKQNQDKFIIFALNPTLKLLTQNNIKPDFIVAIENSNILNQFETINTQDYYLINESFTHSKVIEKGFKKHFTYLSDDNFLNSWIKKCLNINENLKSSGTVSYNALLSAFIMGFDKIILIGQDLAYRNGSCYTKGCAFGALECIYNKEKEKYEIIAPDIEKYAANLVSREIPLESKIKIAKKRIKTLNENLYTTKSQEGKNIPTQTNYAIFIKDFENAAKELINKKPNLKLINSSTGGAQIDGFENIPLAEIVENLEPVEKLNLDNVSLEINKEKIKKELETFLEELKNYSNTIDSFIKNCQNILESNQNPTLLQEHRRLLVEISNFKAKEAIGEIAFSYLYKIQKFYINKNLENAEEMKEICKQITLDYKELEPILKCFIKALSNSQALILK